MATGVEVQIKGEIRKIQANREVILSSGAFQSPQLLLLSGIGGREKLDPHGIEQHCDLPGVGENLHDHIDYTLMYKSNHKDLFGFNPRSVLNIGIDQFRYWRKKRGVLTTNFTEAGAFYYADPSEPSPDTQLHFVYALIDRHGIKKHIASGYSCHVCLLRPKSRGRVALKSSNPDDRPFIDPAFLKEEDDVRSFVRGIRKAQQIMDAPAFDGIRGAPMYSSAAVDDDELIDDVRNRADTIYHPVSTCKMGPATDPMAVVDARLRVRGIDRLRVIDASIMPQIVSGNTNAPSMMIGDKGADMILEDAAA